jgi:hypothetical protein
MSQQEFYETVQREQQFLEDTKMSVYKAINKVQADLSKLGISKDRKNSQGNGYQFRGIDDIYNVVSPLLSQHGLCILPRVISRECIERQSKAGGALFYTTVEVEFDFVCAEDGSKHIVKTFGEAMDTSDKSTNKAMSAAYKYACLQAFAIPTEGDNDADAATHEVAAAPKQVETPKPISLITMDQVTEIQDLANDAGVELSAICAACKVDSLNKIPSTMFASVIKKLNAKFIKE